MSLHTMRAGLAAAVALGIICAGCALPPEKTADANGEKQYRTGSNIPLKEGQATDVRMVDPKSIQEDRPRSIGNPMQKGG